MTGRPRGNPQGRGQESASGKPHHRGAGARSLFLPGRLIEAVPRRRRLPAFAIDVGRTAGLRGPGFTPTQWSPKPPVALPAMRGPGGPRSYDVVTLAARGQET